MRKRTTLALAGVGLLVALSGGMSVTAAYATGGHHGGGHTPVELCHDGHTITIDESAVKAHLHHGDTLGPCAPATEEPTPEPSTPPVTETPEPEPTEEPSTPPQPADEVLVGTWTDQHGEPSCDTHTVATHRTTTTKPYVLVDGVWVVSTDESTWTVSEEEGTRPMTDEEITTCECSTPPTEEPTTPPTDEPTTPPTGEPTTPAPSDGPTSEPTPSAPVTVPTPTDGTTPPPSAGGATPPTTPRGSVPTAPESSATTAAVPVAADTSHGSLAYTGADRTAIIALAISALGLIAIGATVLVMRTNRRRAEIRGGQD